MFAGTRASSSRTIPNSRHFKVYNPFFTSISPTQPITVRLCQLRNYSDYLPLPRATLIKSTLFCQKKSNHYRLGFQIISGFSTRYDSSLESDSTHKNNSTPKRFSVNDFVSKVDQLPNTKWEIIPENANFKKFAKCVKSGNFNLATLEWFKFQTAHKSDSIPLFWQLEYARLLSFNSHSPKNVKQLKIVVDSICSDPSLNQKQFLELINMVRSCGGVGFSSTLTKLVSDGMIILEQETAHQLLNLCGKETDTLALAKILTLSRKLGYLFSPPLYIFMIQIFQTQRNVGMIDLILEMIHDKEEIMSLRMYSSLMTAYSELSQPDVVIKLFQDLQAKGLTPDEYIFNSVIDSLGKAGRLEEMSRYFNMMGQFDLTPDPAILHVIMHANIGDPDRALDHYSKIIEFNNSQYTPTVYTYNILILLHLRKLDLETAMKVRDHMVEMGVQPNWVTFSQFINFFSLRKDHKGAMAVVDEMHKFDVKMTISLLNQLIRLNLELRFYNQATQLINKYSDIKLNTMSYNLLMRYHASNKDYRRVIQIFDTVKELNLPLSINLYDTVLYSMVSLKNVAQLRSTFDDMVTAHKLKPDTTIFNTMMRGLSMFGTLNQCRGLFKYMISHHPSSAPPNIETYNHMLSAYDRFGLIRPAEELVALLERFGSQGSPGLAPNNRTWAILLWLYGQARDLPKLEATFRRFSSPPASLSPDQKVFRALMFGYYSCREISKAKKIFQLSLGKLQNSTTPTILSLYLSVLGAEGSMTNLQAQWIDLPKKFPSTVIHTPQVHTAYLQSLIRCGGYTEALTGFTTYLPQAAPHVRPTKDSLLIVGKALKIQGLTHELAKLSEFVRQNLPELIPHLNFMLSSDFPSLKEPS